MSVRSGVHGAVVWRCAARNTATASEDRGSRYSAGRIAVSAISGRWSVFNSNSASRTHGSGLAGCRRTASPNARRAAVLRPAAVSIVASVNSGSSDERVDVARLLRPACAPRRRCRGPASPARPASACRRASAARPPTPRRATSSSVGARTDGAHTLARAGAQALDEPASRGSARPAPRRRARPPRARVRAQRPAPGDPARRQQRDRGVGGHEPRPVDERVHAEDDHDGDERQQADPLRRERAPAIAPPQAGGARPRSPARRRAARG